MAAMNRRGFVAFLVAAPVTKALPWSAIAKAIAPIAPQAAANITLTLDEIISATIRARTPDMIANLKSHNALLKRLQK